MIKKLLRKQGDAITHPCGCVIEMGAPILEMAGRIRPVHEVIVTRCEKCQAYVEKRDSLIPKAEREAVFIAAKAAANGEKMHMSAAFIKAMDRLMGA